jgi:hypothetical protein
MDLDHLRSPPILHVCSNQRSEFWQRFILPLVVLLLLNTVTADANPLPEDLFVDTSIPTSSEAQKFRESHKDPSKFTGRQGYLHLRSGLLKESSEVVGKINSNTVLLSGSVRMKLFEGVEYLVTWKRSKDASFHENLEAYVGNVESAPFNQATLSLNPDSLVLTVLDHGRKFDVQCFSDSSCIVTETLPHTIDRGGDTEVNPSPEENLGMTFSLLHS